MKIFWGNIFSWIFTETFETSVFTAILNIRKFSENRKISCGRSVTLDGFFWR